MQRAAGNGNQPLIGVTSGRPTVLIAEDDPDDRLIAAEAFSAAGVSCPVLFVEDGAQLLDYLAGVERYADRERYPMPNLLILDLNMPRIDGREALERMHAHPDWCRIPVVVLTTSKAHEDQIRSWRCGIDSYFTKPTSFAVLVEFFRQLKRMWLPQDDAAAATEELTR